MRIKLQLLTFLIFSIQLFAQNPGDNVFSAPEIFEIRFHFKQQNFLDDLYQSQADKEYISGNVEINGQHFDSVGVRFKGNSSFYGYPGDKKSFRIKFDKFTDQRFDGLKKINLNNGWNDPSLLREKLYLDFLYQQNIPAPRANFAKVYIDSIYWGFYSLVEHVDKRFLKHRYGNNDGNLFKAEYAPLTWQGAEQDKYYDDFELKTNEDENNWSDLVNLFLVINNDSLFTKDVENIFNVESYIKAWAANNLFVNLDSYQGSATNYYLYQNEDDNRFEWIIWDVNLAFGARTSNDSLDIFFHNENRPLIERLLNNTTYKNRYIETLEHLINAGFSSEEFNPKIDSLWQMIEEDYLQDTLKMYSSEQVLLSLDENIDNAPGLKPFVVNRRHSVLNQTAITVETNQSPTQFELFKNYPNPFNPETVISYRLEVNSNIELNIYNSLGQEVAQLFSGLQSAGVHKIKWNAVDYSSGVYFCVLNILNLNKVLSRKMLLVK